MNMPFFENINEIGHFTPHFSFFYLLLLALYNNSQLYLYITLIAFIDYGIIGPSLKSFCKVTNLHSPRPRFPHMNGMPSGHTQLIWLLFIFFYFMNSNKFHTHMFGVLAMYIVFQRIYTGMHTPLQVLTGLLLGCCFGYLWYVLYISLNIQ